MTSRSPKTQSIHKPVMPREVIDALQLAPGLTVVDGTVGAGGHAVLIQRKIAPTGRLIGFDRDPMMLRLASEKLCVGNPILIHGSYADAEELLKAHGISKVDRVLLDLGLSSDQLADERRGFGFDTGGPLDMRFDSTTGQTVAEFLQSASVEQIETAIREYGEERQARQIAQAIATRQRSGHGIQTVEELLQCINEAAGRRHSGNIDRSKASRVFQALRVEVNRELQHVENMLTSVLPRLLNTDGIAVVITFHSLEDRIVKNAFKMQSGWSVLTRTPVTPAPAEVRLNPRARSAKVRSAQWQCTPSENSKD